MAAGLALIVYINSLPNGFLSDDVQTIAFSSAAGSPFNLRGLLIGPGLIVRGGSRGTYGPVTAWTFLVAHVMGADLPLVHHLANVVCHVPYLPSLLRGVRLLLKPNGLFVFEDPYLGDIMAKTAIDRGFGEQLPAEARPKTMGTFRKLLRKLGQSKAPW